MEPLHLTTIRHGATVTVSVSGELDIATTGLLRTHLLGVLREAGNGYRESREVIVELSGLSFIDAAGLGMFVGVREQAHRQNTPLLLAAIPNRMNHLLRITGLDGHFHIRPC
jgi:anti-sigma B factor antagonist